MKIIGITGGVGSGKSMILEYLREQTFEPAVVIEADRVAYELQRKGNLCYDAIVNAFGCDILDEAEEIDRYKLGSIVFQDEEQLRRLNALVHPLVKQEIVDRIRTEREKNSAAYLFIEAALLIEEHYDEICDELWYIYVSKEQRYERLRTSRGYSDEKIAQIMNNQLEEETFRRHCQVVIDNTGSKEDTFRQLREVFAWQN